MANQDVRAKIKEAGVRAWMVAEEMGMADSSLSRKMRHELPEEEKKKVFAAIKVVAKRKRAV